MDASRYQILKPFSRSPGPENGRWEYVRVKQANFNGITSVASVRVGVLFWLVLSWKRKTGGIRDWEMSMINGCASWSV